ncbi:MAG: radical SAM protein [Phycisphaeraceae bacterium]
MTIALHVDRSLARTVRLTNRLKERCAKLAIVRRVMDGVDFVARGVYYVWRNRKYLTPLKLANMAMVNLQFKLKTERVWGRPYRMKIESTNICNTQCQLCPTGIGMKGRAKGKMSFENYTGLIDQLKRWLLALDLSMWGDPMIVPDIYRMIRYAHDQGIWTYISSNLHAFKPEKGHAEELIKSGLDMLTCSLHGASQKTFEIYQPGKNFETTVDKVRHIIETRSRMGSQTPQVQLNFVVTKHNEHEVEDFKRLAEKLGCKAVFSWAALNTRFMNQDNNLVQLNLPKRELKQKVEEHIREWLPDDKQHQLGVYAKMLDGEWNEDDFNGKKPYDCHWPWKSSVINWDGEVVTCCGSWDPKEDMGSVFEQPFGKIWNGAKYRMARRSFKKKLGAEQKENNPCATCPGFMV